MTYDELFKGAKALAEADGKVFALLTPNERIEYADRFRDNKRATVHFPIWVKTTKCETRSFKMVLAWREPHGARIQIGTFTGDIETTISSDPWYGAETKWVRPMGKRVLRSVRVR